MRRLSLVLAMLLLAPSLVDGQQAEPPKDPCSAMNRTLARYAMENAGLKVDVIALTDERDALLKSLAALTEKKKAEPAK